MNKNKKITQTKGIVVQGHQVASGLAPNSPFPSGTIEMQLPFFKEEGVNLDGIYPATINVSIAPQKFKLITPQITMEKIKWSKEHKAETFSLSPCKIIVNDIEHTAYVYYPHPETKIGHFKDNMILEILSTHISDIVYGKQVLLKLDSREMVVSK